MRNCAAAAQHCAHVPEDLFTFKQERQAQVNKTYSSQPASEQLPIQHQAHQEDAPQEQQGPAKRPRIRRVTKLLDETTDPRLNMLKRSIDNAKAPE